VRPEMGIAGDDDDVASPPVAVEVEGYPGVAPDVGDSGRVRQAVDEESAAVPQEPHGVGLGRAAGAHGGEPDDALVAQPPGHALAEGRRGGGHYGCRVHRDVLSFAWMGIY